MTDRVTVGLQAENLRIRYTDVLALECAAATIEGNVIAVIGHNGAGKSTFIKTVLGLLTPSSGALFAYKANGDGAKERLIPEKHMAFCPETGSVFNDITVESYLRLWCRFKQRDPNFYRKEGASYLDLLQLTPLLKKLGRELSKGQRRRVQTAIGFLTRPRLFLFDEPFDGLDVLKTHELTAIIEEHQGKMAFVISSHRMDVVERLADKVLVLKEGKFVSYGTVPDVSTQLGGTTLTIHSFRHSPEAIKEFLKNRYPSAICNLLGRQITLTAQSLELERVQRELAEAGYDDPSIETVCPSLVDAMNLHLRGPVTTLR